MTIRYTVAAHFGHENIMGFFDRPCSILDELDAALIANKCDRVCEDDDRIVGELVFGLRAKDAGHLKAIFDQLPGALKYLIAGNHDRVLTLNLP